jgi:hypothetical protein
MAVPRDIKIKGSQHLGGWPAAAIIPAGAAVVVSSGVEGADTIKAAHNEEGILGFAAKQIMIPRGWYDGFWKIEQDVEVLQDYAMAWVTPNGANDNIVLGDYLEVALLGSGSSVGHGILEEASSHTGTTKSLKSVARALESRAMGSKSYKIPAATVAVGDTSITMTGTDIATMGITVGDLILLEDITGEYQVNKVASLTATVIGLVMPSTVVLNNSSDLITRLYQVPVAILR